MRIYVDLIILLNLFLDFILLFTVSLLLKRNASLKRLFLGAIMGGISILTLFISVSSLTLFFIKVLMSIIMVLVTFSYKNIKYTFYNLLYLYLVSIILGGFLYYLNSEFSYKNVGLLFIHKGVSINFILIIIAAPVILFLYVYQNRRLKEEYSKRYEVSIKFLNNKKINLSAFYDTGNKLIDPYKKRPIILINKHLLGNYKPNYILVPCHTVNKESLLKCFKIKELKVNKKSIKKEVLVGVSDNNFNIEGVDLLLHEEIVKEIKDEKNNWVN